jgi:hypothetical protein
MTKVLVAAAMLAAVVIGTAGVATAAPAGKTDAQVIGNVRIDPADPTVGYVSARYICQSGAPGSTAAAHLWVSVKQTADRGPDNALKGEGSSGVSAAWSQSHPTAQVVCDGTWHVDTFTVDQTERGFGALAPGQGYVRFCLFGGDATYTASERFAAVKY